MRPTRVLYVIGSLDRGGAERQLVDLLGHIDRDRFEPAVVCLATAGAQAAAVEALGIPVRVAGYEGFRIKRHPVRTLSALSRLRRAIAEFRPDVVHGLLFWAYVLGAFAARSAGVPVVVASRLSLGHFRSALSPRVLALEAAANRRTDVFVANSEAVRQDAIRGEGLPPERVRVIHNGVDLPRFEGMSRAEARERLGVPQDAVLMVVVANLIHYKGHGVLLDAFHNLRQRDPLARVALLGDGPERGALVSRVASLGLGDSVRFVGSTPEVPTWLAAADLLVHPSFEEGFCNAVLEAMAVGRAVVATKVGGVPEAVIDGRTGWLVPPRDAAALAEAMAGALASPERLASTGEAGRQRVLERFSMAANVEAHELLYKELAGGRS